MFIPFIRDYVEVVNNIYDSTTEAANYLDLPKLIQGTFLYFFQTSKFLLIYLITFQWVRDLIYLPIIVPEISSSILKEKFFLEAPLENIFTIFEIPSYSSNKFLIGFCNSFFLTLPLSCAHLIYVRRFLIQGYIAGITAGLGNILGQVFFIGSILLGFRALIIPWFSFEPFTYIIGGILILNIVYDMVHERVIKILTWSNKSTLFKIFFLNFSLIWTEQSCIFQYLGNISLEADSIIVNNHITYLMGLLLGSLFFNVLFLIFIKNITEFLQIQFSILKSTWVIRLNYFLLTIILTFTFTSIPFYGLDYLITHPLGFISQDKAFKKTIFSSNEITDPYFILSNRGYSYSLATDVSSFDRGIYLSHTLPQSFEELNYSGEYAIGMDLGKIYEDFDIDPELFFYKIFPKREKPQAVAVESSDNSSSSSSTTSKIVDVSGQNKIMEKEKLKETKMPTSYSLDDKSILFSKLRARGNRSNNSGNSIYNTLQKTSFSPYFWDPNALSKLDEKIKRKFYSNPVYKLLLNAEIDLFVKRQPFEFILSPEQEKELYRKRLALSRYNDSLRFYNTLPYLKEFQYFFNGSKSFANRVYNQQFKGTLNVVRRLFSISSSKRSGMRNSEELVLKYDQPLFKSSKPEAESNAYFHEELRDTNSSFSSGSVSNTEWNSGNTANLTSKPEQSSGKGEPKFHLGKNDAFWLTKGKYDELVSQTPLYMGWDENLRKIIITNRVLPKTETFLDLATKSLPSSMPLVESSQREDEKRIEFSTWPNTVNKLENSNLNEFDNSRLLFQTKNTLKKLKLNDYRLQFCLTLFKTRDAEQRLVSYTAVPSNAVYGSRSSINVIPPNRGGFIWPGSSLKIPIKAYAFDAFERILTPFGRFLKS